MTMEQSVKNANHALPYLVCYAKKGKTITYKELAEKIGSHPHALSYTLGIIRDNMCLNNGYPMITTIVVKADTGEPGDDFLPEGTLNLSTEEKRNKFEENKKKVFSFTEWDKLLKEYNLIPVSDKQC